MYIGKTGRISVEDRLNQHKTDAIGMWCKDHPFYIEFLELPKEEDMNYIESYLIRKYTPKCNTIFADNTKLPPFEIVINENLWKSYDKYIEEKKNYAENMMKISQENISSNISAIIKSNEEFEENIKNITNGLTQYDKYFLSFLKERKQPNQETISIPYKYIFWMYKIKENDTESLNKIIKKLLNIKYEGKLPGTINTHTTIELFKEIYRDNDVLIFTFGKNYQYILNKLLQ